MSSPVIDHETLRFGRLLHYAGLAIVLVVGAAAYSWFYTPVEARHSRRRNEDRRARVSRSKTPRSIRREHERLSSHLQDIEARYAALEERVPINAEAGSFLKHVSEIAQRRAAGDQQLSAGAVGRPATAYTAMEVMLDGKGSFQSICSFFDRLSKIQRLSKVKDLQRQRRSAIRRLPDEGHDRDLLRSQRRRRPTADEEVSRG